MVICSRHITKAAEAALIFNARQDENQQNDHRTAIHQKLYRCHAGSFQQKLV